MFINIICSFIKIYLEKIGVNRKALKRKQLSLAKSKRNSVRK